MDAELLPPPSQKRYQIDLTSKVNFLNLQDLLGRSLYELLSELDMSLPVILDLVRLTSAKVAPTPLSVGHFFIIGKGTYHLNGFIHW